MKHLEAVVEILRQAREARQWTDEAVASDLCTQLGLDPNAEAKKATVVKPDDAPPADTGPKPSTHPLDMAPGTLEPNLPPVPAPPSQQQADQADAAQEQSVVDKGETQDAGKPSTRSSFGGVASSDDDSKDSKRK